MSQAQAKVWDMEVEPKPPVLVLGVGNILLSDEGVGVRVVERLAQRYELPAQVEVLDGGTAGMALMEHLHGRRHVIVVDAVKSGAAPGTLVTLTGEAVPTFFAAKISPHQIALADVLALLELSGERPAEITVIGIEPESLDTGLELTSTIARRLDELEAQVVASLTELGYAPTALRGDGGR